MDGEAGVLDDPGECAFLDGSVGGDYQLDDVFSSSFLETDVTNLSAKPKDVVRFYNGRGMAEQWIKEGKYALNWTRLSCHRFVANQVRLQLFILAYNLGNFLRRLVLPGPIKDWSLRSLQAKLIKMGGRMVHHARRIIFQLSEVAISRELFAALLGGIARLSLAPG